MATALLPSGLKRILIVCPNWLGDVLFATPFIRALKNAYPECRLDALLPQRVQSVLKNNPHIQKTIVYNERIHLGTFFQTALLAVKLRSQAYDAAIFLAPSKSKIFLMRSAGIGLCAGRTHRTTVPSSPLHKIDTFLGIAAELGIPSSGREMEFYPDKTVQASLEQKLKLAGIAPSEPYAVIHIGGNWILKRWPLEHFADWVRLWVSQQGGHVVICGTASESHLSQALCKKVNNPKLVSLCGQTSLDELALLLGNARLVLSNDSGPVHLAATQRVPVVALFGPTSSELTGPVSLGKLHIFQSPVGCAVPCYYHSCNDHLCMQSIVPQQVFEKTMELAR